MHFTLIVAIVAVTLRVGHARKRTPIQRIVLAAIGLAIAYFPLGALHFAGYLRGLVGDLSILTTTVVLVFLLSELLDTNLYKTIEETQLLSVVLVMAIFLYPMALGLSSFDPYTLGYGGLWLVGPLLVLVIVAWYWEYYLIVGCLVTAVGAHALDVLESRNLWDYLVDPWIASIALVLLTSRASVAYGKWRKPRCLPATKE